jgi:hypothetical protein
MTTYDTLSDKMYKNKQTHTHTRARARARAHAHTHTHTHTNRSFSHWYSILWYRICNAQCLFLMSTIIKLMKCANDITIISTNIQHLVLNKREYYKGKNRELIHLFVHRRNYFSFHLNSLFIDSFPLPLYFLFSSATSHSVKLCMWILFRFELLNFNPMKIKKY